MSVSVNVQSIQNEGAFLSYARAYFDMGLSVIPAGGADGKKPLIKAYQKRRLGPDEIESLGKKYPSANLAIVTGLSNLAVIDVDDPSDRALKSALHRFGNSPVIVRTGGRLGHQIYYRTRPGLRPHDFRHSEKLPLELRTDGNIIVAPPSVNPKTMRVYEFISGAIDEIESLPLIDIKSIHHLFRQPNDKSHEPHVDRNLQIIALGYRNNWLFSTCLRAARNVDDFDALLDVAMTRADEYFSETMSPREVRSIALSAWGYQQRGRNWVATAARYPLTLQEMRGLEELGSDAAVLALHLRLEHGGRMERGEDFALDTRAMEDAHTIAGWSRGRFRRAIEKLGSSGILRLTHQGSGRGDPNQYRITMFSTMMR